MENAFTPTQRENCMGGGEPWAMFPLAARGVAPEHGTYDQGFSSLSAFISFTTMNSIIRRVVWKSA
jgi:hypothetical protein